ADKQSANTVLLEAGGGLLGAFNDADLIDEWVIYLTPFVAGGPTPAVEGQGASSLVDRHTLKNLSIHQVGNDLCARGIVDRSGPCDLER
ncbi:MAG: dihydrofolate reductase family protein, partial [Akkermansiaceae bacterium]